MPPSATRFTVMPARRARVECGSNLLRCCSLKDAGRGGRERINRLFRVPYRSIVVVVLITNLKCRLLCNGEKKKTPTRAVAN